MSYTKTTWVNNTTPINETNLNKIESGIKNNDINIGEENYDNTKTYEVGDIVRYNEKIYKCITAITTAENFDISKWKQTNIVEIVQSEKSKIYELIEALSTPIVGEGENITLNDTAEKRFENFDIEGNSEQEATPSPDYPSEIKSVGSNINILPSDLFSSASLNGINYTNKDGIITVNGTATENSFYAKTITLKAGTYTLNGAPNGSAQDRYCLQAQGLGAGDFGSGQTFTIDTEKQVTLRIMVWKGITVNNIIFKPKLIKGTVATPYSKYGQGCVKVTKCNKNIMPILNLGNNYEYTGNGIKSLKRNDGVEVTRFKVRKGQTIKIGLKMISRPSKDSSYTIYFKDNNNIIAAFSHINASSDIELNKVYEKSYTANEDGEIFIKLWGNASSDIFEFQLWAELDNLTEYEQHEEQSYTIPTQQPMRAIGDTRDKFIKKNNKWYEHHPIVRIESYNGETITSEYISNTGELSTGATVDYISDTPVDIECTEEQSTILFDIEQNAKTYKGVTHIYSNDAVSPNCYVEAAKDLTTLIQ